MVAGVLLATLLTFLSGPKQLLTQYESPRNERLLLAFKALPPHEKRERNLYDLAERITGFIDPGRFPPTGVVVGDNVRYGVYSVRRVRLVGKTDSREAPVAVGRQSQFVLVLNALYTLCATEYRVEMKTRAAGQISYVDCEVGGKYVFPVNAARAVPIFEIETLTANIFEEVWKQYRPPR